MRIERLFILAFALLPHSLLAQNVQPAASSVQPGSPEAINGLGVKYERGTGVPVDYAKARQYYTQAAQAGYGLAYSNLGNLYANGLGGPVNLVQAARYFAQGAQLGSPQAQTNLGYAYENGRGVPRDYALAVRYYEQAAQAGYPLAQANLGHLYEHGFGVAPDLAAAFHYYSLAAQAGNATALNNLGHLYQKGLGVPQDYGLALRYYTQAAQGGSALALSNLGYLYSNGLGVTQDDVMAARYNSQAAQAGDPQGMSNIGYAYATGRGVPQDRALAFRYYLKAAQAGNIHAYNNLATVYLSGKGAPKDHGLAFKYFTIAANGGDAQAQSNLAYMYKNGQGVAKDVGRAISLFQQSAAGGYGAGAFNLGLIYRDGLDDIAPNPTAANTWFKKAVDLGYTQAASFVVKPGPVASSRTMVAMDAPAAGAPAPATPVQLTGATVPKGPRLALIIANGDYAPNLNTLKNPVNDGKLMAAALAKAGFTVTARYNLGTLQIKDALSGFVDALRKAGPSTTALFYYAGHGAAYDGVNYLIPVGQVINSETTLQTYGQSADDVLKLLDQAKPVTTIVILDACRNVAFGSSRGSTGGLAQMDARNGSIIAYATAPGKLAADGDGDDSPYSAALAALIQKSDEPVEIVFRRVRATVIEQTQNEQTPWESTSLVSDFVFHPK